MKILYCTFSHCDYGTGSLYNGLCQLLGSQNIYEFPIKPSFHGDTSDSYRYYPLFYNYPENKGSRENLLKKNFFDIIIVCCDCDHDFRYNRHTRKTDNQAFFELLKKKSQTTPTFLVDQGDSAGINHTAIKDYNAKLYFKRELYPDDTAACPVLPLSFSYSTQNVPTNEPRVNDFFWAGNVLPNRRPFVDVYEKFRRKPSFNRWTQSKYSGKLLNHKIALNLKGLGNDTVRFYEIPAHGALLFSEKLDIVMDHPFTDGKNAVFFNDVDDMKTKLDYYLKNELAAEKIRKAGFLWYKKYHTSKARAKQLMTKIKQVI
jgi:hypothetical protein